MFFIRKGRYFMFVTPGEHAAIVWVTDMAQDDAKDIGTQRGSIWTYDHLLHVPPAM